MSAGERGLDGLVRALEKERDLLEHLRFRFVAVGLVLEHREVRFVEWAVQDLEASRARVREADLVRAAEVGLLQLKSAHAMPSLREVAAAAASPWSTMLRDHHDGLATVIAEIEVHGHLIAESCRAGLADLAHTGSLSTGPAEPAGCLPPRSGQSATATATAADPARLRAPGQGEELDPGSIEVLLGTALRAAGRLRLPALLAFLR